MILYAAAFVVLAGCGAALRAVAGHHLNATNGVAWGTFTVNVTGCFILGLLHNSHATIASVVGTAFLGALTTFSSFVRDVIALFETKQRLLAFAYLTTSLAAGVAIAGFGSSLT